MVMETAHRTDVWVVEDDKGNTLAVFLLRHGTAASMFAERTPEAMRMYRAPVARLLEWKAQR